MDWATDTGTIVNTEPTPLMDSTLTTIEVTPSIQYILLTEHVLLPGNKS